MNNGDMAKRAASRKGRNSARREWIAYIRYLRVNGIECASVARLLGIG